MNFVTKKGRALSNVLEPALKDFLTNNTSLIKSHSIAKDYISKSASTDYKLFPKNSITKQHRIV